MSDLTEEFVDLYTELAAELGEGLTATLLVRPTASYDEATSRVVTPPGEPVEVTFACAPPSVPKDARGGGDEADRAAYLLTMPRTLDDSSAIVTPKRGDLLRLRDVTYQVVSVRPLTIGDGVAGFQMGLRT